MISVKVKLRTLSASKCFHCTAGLCIKQSVLSNVADCYQVNPLNRSGDSFLRALISVSMQNGNESVHF